MSSHIGSVSIYIEADDPPTASLNPGNGKPFAVLELTPTGRASAYIALRTRADADALVKAALAARDLLPAPVRLDQLRDRPHYTPEPQWDADGTPANPPAANMDAAEASVCGPGACTCGASVSADGTVTK